MRPFTPVTGARDGLGECPLWSVREQALYHVDIVAPAIHRDDLDSGESRVLPVSEEVGCIGLARAGGFVAGMRSGLWRLDTTGAQVRQLAANPEDTATSRFNDGRVDRAGRFWAGTLDQTRRNRAAALYRYDRRGLVPMRDGLLTSNGLAFSPDGRWLYHADTPSFTVYRHAFDIESGGIGPAQPWLRVSNRIGQRFRPDGAAVDAEGCYWTALYEGGCVRRYSPDAVLLAEYALPVRCPTMVAFGGPDLRTLFVTSARAGRPEAELAACPLSGALFSMPVEVPGLAEPEFEE